MGITICPEVSVQKELSEKSLVKLNWSEKDVETSVIMIWHSEKWCSPLLERFMVLSCEEFQVPDQNESDPLVSD